MKILFILMILFSSSLLFAQTPGALPKPTPTQAQLRYLGLWDGQAIQNGVATDVALNFAFLQNGSFVGEIQIKATKQAGAFSSSTVKPDGSIVFVLSLPNGSVRTHTGTLDASGQKMTGTFVHSLGTQSATGTFSATKRAAPQAAVPQPTPMTVVDVLAANRIADKIEADFKDAQKSDSKGATVFGITGTKFTPVYFSASDCIKKYPTFARCYALRGQITAAEDRDRSLEDLMKNIGAPNPRFKAAIEDLTKAISLLPDWAYLYHVRGSIYLNSWNSNPKLAQADAEAALKIDPTYAPAKTLLTDAQKKIGPK